MAAWPFERNTNFICLEKKNIDYYEKPCVKH